MRLNADLVMRGRQIERAANPLTARFVGGVNADSGAAAVAVTAAVVKSKVLNVRFMINL